MAAQFSMFELLGNLLVGLALEPPPYDHPGVLHELRLVEVTHQQRALEHRHRLGRSLVAGRLAERLRHCWQQRRHKIDCELEPRHHSLAVDPHERNHANRPVAQLPQDHRGTILLAEQLPFTAC